MSNQDEATVATNKEIVLDFLKKAINQANFEAAAVHFGSRYIQHNPAIGDGIEGIRKHMNGLHAEFPQLRGEVKRVIAEGDLLVAHIHARRTPAARNR
jgi:predicted SnoaL-like aldol condensation-catalyzing enzyme